MERVASLEQIVRVGPYGMGWFGKKFRCFNNLKAITTPHQSEMESVNCWCKSYQDFLPNKFAMHLERHWKVAKSVNFDCAKFWRKEAL